MTATEKAHLRHWLCEMKRPDLTRLMMLRLCLVSQTRLTYHLLAVGRQHPELGLEDWIARARARALCERAVKKPRWMLLALLLTLGWIASPPPATAQGIDVIHVQNNGVAQGTLAGPFTLNCTTSSGTPCTITNGPKTLSINFAAAGTLYYQLIAVDGVSVPPEPTLNFVNAAGVFCADNSGASRTDCELSYTQLQINGVNQPTHDRLNFTSGVACTSNDPNNSSDCDILLPTFQTNGINNGSQSTLNLKAGSNVTITNAGSDVTITSGGAASLPVTTVASLPSGIPAGEVVVVSDWNGVGGVCTGGGSTFGIAIFDGTNWQCSTSNSAPANSTTLLFASTVPQTQTAAGTPFNNQFTLPAGTTCPSVGTVYHLHFMQWTVNGSATGNNVTSFGIAATRVFTNIGPALAGNASQGMVADIYVTCLSLGNSASTSMEVQGTMEFGNANTGLGVGSVYAVTFGSPFTVDTTGSTAFVFFSALFSSGGHSVERQLLVWQN